MAQAPPEMDAKPTRGGSIGPTLPRKSAVMMSSSIEVARATPYGGSAAPSSIGVSR